MGFKGILIALSDSMEFSDWLIFSGAIRDYPLLPLRCEESNVAPTANFAYT